MKGTELYKDEKHFWLKYNSYGRVFCLWSKPISLHCHRFPKEVGIFKVNSQCKQAIKHQRSVYAWGILSDKDSAMLLLEIFPHACTDLTMTMLSAKGGPEVLCQMWLTFLPKCESAHMCLVCQSACGSNCDSALCTILEVMQDECDKLGIPLQRLLLRCLPPLI